MQAKLIVAAALLMTVALDMRATTAQEMLSACRPLTRAATRGPDYVDVPVTYEAGLCWGSFDTLQSLARYGDKRTGRRLLRICPPAKSRLLQFVAIFVKFAEDHPERLHEDFAFVAWDSLREAFPCTSATEQE